MHYLMIVAGASILGAYSVAGLHYYSVAVSRTRSEWTRLALSISAMALFFFVPMVGCMFLLGTGDDPGTKLTRGLWLLFVLFCWIGPVYFYMIRCRTVLRNRLRGRPGQKST
jgi:hypothetical protein